MRADKWLWCVRAFPTRTAATQACDRGRVLINEEPIKPARELRPGDTLEIRSAEINRTLVHRADPRSRVGPALVAEYCTDATSPEELRRRELTLAQRLLQRPRGEGRPTKRDRRALDRLEESQDS
jgi:ribosome-associated heat shock protein Hsp15